MVPPGSPFVRRRLNETPSFQTVFSSSTFIVGLYTRGRCARIRPQARAARAGDPRVIRTQPLFDSALDFVGLHLHPGVELTVSQYMQNFELTAPVVKPVVLDDFGAFQYAYPTAGDGNLALQGVEAESCAYGIDRWLFWSWDTTEFAAGDPPLWNELSSGGVIGQGLGRVTSPSTSRTVASQSGDGPSANAVDGLMANRWGAGGYPPQWIDVDLGGSVSVGRVRLFIDQFRTARRSTASTAARRPRTRGSCCTSSTASRSTTRCSSTSRAAPGRTSATCASRRLRARRGLVEGNRGLRALVTERDYLDWGFSVALARAIFTRATHDCGSSSMTSDSSLPAFAREGLLRRAAPFLGAMLLALCVYPLPPTGNEPRALGGAAVLSALIVLVALFAPWSRLPRFAEVVPPLAYFVVIALLRESDGGGRSAYSVLAMLPMFWLALYGSRRDLGVAIAAVAAVFLTPPLLVGAPEYPSSEWTRAILWTCVAPIVGYTVQGLVRELRTRAIASARQAEQLLASQEVAHQLIVNMAAVTDATREISRTTDADVARQVICSAACTITGGRFATLMEPDGPDALVMTANYGLQGSPPIRLQLDGEPSGATQAFSSGKAIFVDDARTSTQVSQRLTRATGAVSIHFEPVVRNEEPIGVLAVGWNHVIEGLERQTISAIRMLAAETAMMIERANLLAKLEQSARTDDLTGLLNRRAWEETLPREMARARRAPHPLCVAMLDLDFFKAYNDERGHQAGDRLLKQSTSAWASELRASDVLSRYGGEEFTVALPGCSLSDAKSIVERLRAAMPSGQTVSAGVACWNGRESAEELVGRADAALYEAKRTGRDRLVTAGDTGDLRSVAL